MRLRGPVTALLILAAAGILRAGQDAPEAEATKPPEPLFVRVSVYPTASLSRFDFNNDLDLYEIRTYIELRRGSQDGPPIADAVVTSVAEKLDYIEGHYEKRTVLDKSRLPAEIEVRIAVKGRPPIRETFPVPDWLVLTEPRPAVLDAAKDLTVRWGFGRFLAPVDVSAYDFRSGRAFFEKVHQAGTSALIPASALPRSTIVRIFVIQSWLYKRFLSGPDYARGSEVMVIPWSQVFVRTT